MELDINEIKRYMNYQVEELDSKTTDILKSCIELIEKEVNLKSCYEVFDIRVNKNQIIFENTELIMESASLAKHVESAHKVIMMAATLGSQVDRMIKRLEITNLAQAYIFNAVAVEYIEKYCDEIEKKLRDEYNKSALFLTSRFSAGYGDLSLDYQKDIGRLLNTNKKIGLSVMDNCIMTPSKSVTALIGIQNHEDVRGFAKCRLCLETGHCSGRCREEQI